MKTHHSFEHGNVSEALPSILSHVMMDGEEVGTRQGERAKEILIPRIALWKPWEREVLVPGRKASLPAQIAETMWVLAGRNDVEWLSHYLPRAAEFSDDGKVWKGGYGPRIRDWRWKEHPGFDQLKHVVDLLNNERGTRRAVINIYDPVVDRAGKDVPCNNWLSFISRLGKLHMNVATRSNDVMWGWSGINQFEWSVLQEIVAHLTGNQIGTLTFNVTSLHVYEKHWDKAVSIIDSSGTTTYDHLKASPRFSLEEYRDVARLDKMIGQWFEIEELIRVGKPMEYAVDVFPEPMMRSWLRVIQWYWSRDSKFLEPIKGTRLCVAAMMSPKRKPTAAEQAVLNNPHVSEAIKETLEIKVPVTQQPDGTVIGTLPASLRPARKTVTGMSITVPSGDEVPIIPDTDLFNFLRAHEGDTIRLDDHHTAVVGPVIPPTRGPKPDLVINDEEFSTRDKVAPLAWTAQFVEFVDNLHREKSAVYGDSWKKRGELLSILANVARKVDRLGEAGAGDSSADTVIDLLVYLVKYRLWLNALLPHESKNRWAPEGEDDAVRAVLNVEDQRCVKVVQHASVPPRIVALKEFFEQLRLVAEDDAQFTNLQARIQIVDHMITLAFPVARYFWGVENGHLLNPYQAAELFTSPLASVAQIARARAEIQKANETRRWAGYENEGENID